MVLRIKVSKYFHLDEFVDPHTYFKDADRGLSKVDKRLFAIADLMREKLGKPLSINNWWSFYQKNSSKNIDWVIEQIEQSRLSKWSGIRTDRCTIGTKASAHRLGRAIDPKGNEVEMYGVFKQNLKQFYDLGVRRIEDPNITKGWFHIDTHELNFIPNRIRVVGLRTLKEVLIVK